MEELTLETLEQGDNDANFEGDESEHDQLPDVDAYKAENSIRTESKVKKATLILLGIFAIVAIIIAGSVAGSNAKKRKNDGRIDQVRSFLVSHEITTEFGRSQAKAAAFIADYDERQMPLTEEHHKKFVERYVLALLYYHYGGPEWRFNLKFLSRRDHCEWHDDFKTNDGDQTRLGVICDINGHVRELNLGWNRLKGSEMPREIEHLSELESFRVLHNKMNGYFPLGFRYMKKLKEISFMNTSMFGTIPIWIGEMTQLTSLGLGDNNMRGGIPKSFENLVELRTLLLDGNKDLKGDIAPIKMLSNLESISLEGNDLSGNLSSFHWPKLLELDVSNNALTGTLPAGLLHHENLQVLDINRNLMFGEIPTPISVNTKLEYFSAFNVGFKGTIPTHINFLKNLKHLDLSFNSLTGTIPKTLTHMTGLRYLATAGNRFHAQPMLPLSNLTNLVDLSMKHNNITGKIIDDIGLMTNLKLLDLDANRLSGHIPSGIGLLTGLDILLLNRNNFTGTIPSQFRNIRGLAFLMLDGNSLTGDASAICDHKNKSFIPKTFVADCFEGPNGQDPEIICPCCSECCADAIATCNDKKWTSNLDPSYEHGYERAEGGELYFFSNEDAPVEYAKDVADDDIGGRD